MIFGLFFLLISPFVSVYLLLYYFFQYGEVKPLPYSLYPTFPFWVILLLFDMCSRYGIVLDRYWECGAGRDTHSGSSVSSMSSHTTSDIGTQRNADERQKQKIEKREESGYGEKRKRIRTQKQKRRQRSSSRERVSESRSIRQKRREKKQKRRMAEVFLFAEQVEQEYRTRKLLRGTVPIGDG